MRINDLSDYKPQIHLLLLKSLGIVGLFLSFKIINYYYGNLFFGIFTISIVYTQIGALLGSFGIPIYTMKAVSKTKKQYRKEYFTANNLFTNLLVIILLSSIVSLIFIFFYFFFNFLKNDINFLEVICICVSLLSLSVVNFNAQILRSFAYFKSTELLSGVIVNCLFAILLIIVSELNINSFNVFLLYAISNFTTMILSLFFVMEKTTYDPTLYFTFKESYTLVKKSFDFFVTQLTQQGFNWVTILITSYLISKVDAGGFNIMVRYLSLSALVIAVTNTFKGPDYTYLFHSNNIKELNSQILKNTRFMMVLGLPLLFIFFVFPKFLLHIFSEDYDYLVPTFRLLILGAFINVYCGSVGMLMQLTNQQKLFKKVMLFSLIIHILLSYIFTVKFGIIGLAISSLISISFWNVYSVLKLKHDYGIKSYFSLSN